jgi:mannose-6-phosphate isomerase-like protein (cupin superfamily)
MKANEVAAQLRLAYPGKPVIFLPDEENPAEIIVEIEKTDITSTAMAVIDRSAPHFHRRTREIYVVERGRLNLHFNRAKVTLEPGGVYIIHPGHVHWAEGASAWVRVICTPPWTADDHELVRDRKP